MGWLIALGILILLALLPLGVSVRYDSRGVVVRVILGPVRLTLIPRKKKEPKKKKESKKQEPPAEGAAPEKKKTPPPEKTGEGAAGGSLTDFLPLVKIGLEMLDSFRRKLRADRLELKLILGGDDPCDLAVNYGKTWAAVGNLMPMLERALTIRQREVEVECDFTSDRTLVIARLDLTITLGRLLALGAVYGVRALTAFLKIQKKRKGGAVK